MVDLDKLIAEPIYFQFRGKAYKVEPVTTARFVKMVQSLGRIQGLLDKKDTDGIKSTSEVYDVYEEFITTLCPHISRQDIELMSMGQIAALTNLLINHMMGRTQTEEIQGEDAEKKNTKLA